MMKRIYKINSKIDASSVQVIVDAIKNSDNDAKIDLESLRLYVDYSLNSLSTSELKRLICEATGFRIKLTLLEDEYSEVKLFDKDAIILIIRILLASILAVLGVFVFKSEWYYTFSFCIVGYLIVAYDIVLELFKNIIARKNIFDENLLMILASVGAFAIQEFGEGLLVMILSQAGELLEDISLKKSKNSIIGALDRDTALAHILVDDKYKDVNKEDVKIGDTLLIKVGEMIPVDGEIISGFGNLDTSSITGESYPLIIKTGTDVLSGYVLESGTLIVKAKKEYKNSTIAQVLKLVVDSSNNKSKAENFIEKFAAIYTPIVIILAVSLALIPPVFNNEWIYWLKVALNFLVIACPCAILISIPLLYFVGVALASKNGIIVKGTNYLERLADLNTLFFDKTGTITSGRFQVVKTVNIGIKKEQFLEYLYVLEMRSGHPIGKAIISDLKLDFSGDFKGKYREIAGFGIDATYKKKHILLGSEKLMVKNGVSIPSIDSNSTVILMAINKEYVGYVVLEDKLKNNSQEFIDFMNKHKVDLCMLTGDHESSAKKVANALGIGSYKADLLPNQKLEFVEEKIGANKRNVVGFMGDGFNDAPCIARADVGVAMGSGGSDMSKVNADVVIVDSDPLRLVDAIKISKSTRIRSIIAIVFSLALKITIMVLSLYGLIDMWIAVLTDTGLTLVLVIYASLFFFKKVRH